ncbi:hypothetical protein [Halobacterium rubrum]|uniref:hypothetical protein n=1 Tax=Halobacterium TaxID=2239 RepID=UPI001F38482A|nr:MULTISPECIES: hypothetical protein [Halobacterium]MDH5019132.1 hypothetical protein [Halobacterium rubrum]
MRRRQFLASGVALLPFLAGCAHPTVVLDMDEATADDVADEVSTPVDGGSTESAVVEAALENGTATRRSRTELFDRSGTVRFDGAFYEVASTELESDEVTVYDVVVETNPEDSTPSVGEVAYADLPEVDREHLEPVVTDENADSSREELGVRYGTAEEVGNESVFVTEPQYDVVTHQDSQYRVTVESRTTTETEYRYELTEVSSDVETFADSVRDRYQFELSELSEAERDVVEAAIDGGYFEESDAFRSVVDRIRDHEGIDTTDAYGTWLVEYEDTAYITYVEW